MLVSAVQQSGSNFYICVYIYMCVYICIFFFRFFSIIDYYKILNIAPYCYTVGPCSLSVLYIVVYIC